MTDKLAGDGLLEDWNSPRESHVVDFEFEITHLPNGDNRSSGSMRRRDGGELREGIYRLAMDDGVAAPKNVPPASTASIASSSFVAASVFAT
jgi:hypothetical protein